MNDDNGFHFFAQLSLMQCGLPDFFFSNGIDMHPEFVAKLFPCVDDPNIELGL
jgi:hypothetical protein